MAVKSITNKELVMSANIKREQQTHARSRDEISRGGNSKSSFVPGYNLSKSYAIELVDIDTAILSHVKNVIRPTVRESGEQIKVTVMYGNEERWKAVRKRGHIRDRNGSLILPLIMMKRTDVSKNELSGQHMKHSDDISIVRNSRWSKKNAYTRFAVQRGNIPQFDSIMTSLPDHRDITYEFVLWTSFIEQMNPLVEMFVRQSDTYWGDTSTFKFCSYLDTISDATEMDSKGERFVKSTFSLTTKAYLLPEYINTLIKGKIPTLKVATSPSRVIFGTETDATDEQVS
jgi:hypothetical protein